LTLVIAERPIAKRTIANASYERRSAQRNAIVKIVRTGKMTSTSTIKPTNNVKVAQLGSENSLMMILDRNIY
jgi:hypothetical protein